jgi:hypothetical protein
MREACLGIASSPHVIDVEFTELGDHVHSETLRQQLQERVDAAGRGSKSYDAILLLFGICGNATLGLEARQTRLVMPRAHDCCTILLGSKEAFREHFGDNPSMPFSSAGYLERGDYYLRVEEGENRMHFGDAYAAYVEQYGEENAKYIWETMHPQHPELEGRAVFIDLPETRHLGYAAQFERRVTADGKTCVVLGGSLRLVRALLHGEWAAPDFLIVPPGHRVKGIYDWSEIVRAEPAT